MIQRSLLRGRGTSIAAQECVKNEFTHTQQAPKSCELIYIYFLQML